MKKFKIRDYEIILEDFEYGQGKIIISSSYGGNYSYYWGSMGSEISEFIKRINSGYFASKLCYNIYEFCPKKTMTNIRKAISEELPWYEHMAFQKEMRYQIKEKFKHCESTEEFVYSWDRFVNSLDYWLIEDRFDRSNVESIFQGFCEIWHFAGETLTHEYKDLLKLHGELIDAINKKKYRELIEV